VRSIEHVSEFFCGRFHHNAYFAARALHVAQAANASLVYPLLELVFENQVCGM
jgi:hypothetical protein